MVINCISCGAKLVIPASAKINTGTSLICPACKTIFKPDESLKYSEKNTNIPGWLVFHDEKAPQKTFALKWGRQLIGRKSKSKPCDIMIETNDKTMGRNHFFIDVVINKRGKLDYILTDAGSFNRTYINRKNLKEMKKGDEIYLEDGDLIQAGETKIIFKSNKSVKTMDKSTDKVVSGPNGTELVR